jgi:hypothetical protein
MKPIFDQTRSLTVILSERIDDPPPRLQRCGAGVAFLGLQRLYR